MRNCFIPYCDAVCRNNPRRMMFRPPRDEEMLTKWVNVLPKHRKLKTHDKICERHFLEGEIIKTWTHTIQGVVMELDRGKPSLITTAVPSQNLTSQKDALDKKNIKMRGPYKRRKRNTDEDTKLNAPISTLRPVKGAKPKAIQVSQETTTEDSTNVVECHEDATAINKSTPEESTNESEFLDEFENFYDDVFEVALPHTLWGLHRDPGRKFIVFTCLDPETISTTKAVYVNDECDLRIYLQGKLISDEKLEKLSVDKLNELLVEVDENIIEVYENGDDIC